jgi:hypothetical protein
MKVELIERKELQKPALEISIDLESGANIIILQYRCDSCAGYGCHRHGGSSGPANCNGGTIKHKLEAKDVLRTLGPEFRPLIEKLYMEIVKEQ